MRIITKQVEMSYKEFDIGEVVRPSSSRCPLPPGDYIVAGFLPPCLPYELDSFVQLKGVPNWVEATYLWDVASATEED